MAVPGYLFDTSALSTSLDTRHPRHRDVRAAINELDPESTFVSVIVLAELGFGVRLAESNSATHSPYLEEILTKAQGHAVLELTQHTAFAYAELKAALADAYLANALRRHRPRWVEDWVDKATGKKLQVDENDLWICAQAKERDLTVVTTDRGMGRIRDADSEVVLLIL